MTQTKKASLIESIINVVVGFGVSFISNATIFPLFGWEVSATQNIAIGCIYSVISVVRSYSLRRLFNFLNLRKRIS